MTAPEFLNRLSGVRPTGSDKWQAQCPAHPDKNPSLSIGADAEKLLIHCHSGCEPESIMAALGLDLRDLFTGNGLKAAPQPERRVGEIVATYDYAGPDGKLLYQVVRYKPKDFRQWRPDGSGGWTWNLKGVNPVLYKLPQVLDAVRAGQRVFVVEGERDVESLCSLDGLVATTNSGGAGKWRLEFSESLVGADAVIIPDADEPGRKHAEQVARSLYGKARLVKVLNLPGPGKDISAWLTAGGSREQLEALADGCPEWTLPPVAVEIIRETPALPLPPEQINSFNQTQAGDAELFSLLYSKRVKYSYRLNKWLYFEGPHWNGDCEEIIDRLCLSLARVRYQAAIEHPDRKAAAALALWALHGESKQRRDALLDWARSMPDISDRGEWDINPLLLGVQNGTVDLVTGELREGAAGDRIIRFINLPYDPATGDQDAETLHPDFPHRWVRFVREIFDGDTELIHYVHKCIGYSLTGSTRDQIIFFCHGQGCNGKSVLFSTLLHVFGSLGYNTGYSTFETNRPGIPADLAHLDGPRLVTASEFPENSRLNESRLKMLSGGDRATARHLYKNEFQFQPVCKVWLSFNTPPLRSDFSYGFQRRVRLVPFKKVFDPAQEPDLLDKLLSESAGILGWAVQGCLAWQETGLQTPAAVKAATQEYEQASDPLSGWFIEMVEPDAGAETQVRPVYQNYRTWAEANGTKILSSTALNRRLRSRFNRVHRAGGDFWQGLRLLKDKD